MTTTIADLYFVHQRGLRLAMWGLCLSVGVGGGSIISGYIIQDLGWNWTYGICAILYGVWILVLFFFCPETAYRRDAVFNTDLSTKDHAEELAEKKMAAVEEKHEDVEAVERTDTNITWSEPKHSYLYELQIFHGRQSDDPYWKVLVRPLMMLIFPQVLFSFFAYGLTTSWLIVVGGILAQVFTAPPYNFTISGVGLVAVAPLIGAIIGAFITGPLADWVVKFMSRRNNGIYEPEFRLVIIFVTLTIGGMSFFGFGWSLQVHDPWIGPVIFYGLQYFSVGFMSIAVYGYLTDCHRDKAPEAFAAINLRNIYSFGMNYFISSWISSQGPKGTCASSQLAGILTVVKRCSVSLGVCTCSSACAQSQCTSLESGAEAGRVGSRSFRQSCTPELDVGTTISFTCMKTHRSRPCPNALQRDILSWYLEQRMILRLQFCSMIKAFSYLSNIGLSIQRYAVRPKACLTSFRTGSHPFQALFQPLPHPLLAQ